MTMEGSKSRGIDPKNISDKEKEIDVQNFDEDILNVNEEV